MRVPKVGELWRTKSCKTQWRVKDVTGNVVTLENPSPGPSSVDYVVRFMTDLQARFEPVPTRWLEPESVARGPELKPCNYRGCPYPRLVLIATQLLCPYCAATTGTPKKASVLRASVLSPAPKWPQGRTPIINFGTVLGAQYERFHTFHTRSGTKPRVRKVEDCSERAWLGPCARWGYVQ